MQVQINNNIINNIVQGSLEINRKTNGERSCNVSIFDENSIVKDGDELEVFDGTTKLFGGTITSVNYSFLTPLNNPEPLIQMNISSDGYNFIPTRRVVTYGGTNTNAGAIVNSMLAADILGGDTISAGTILNGPPLTSYYARAKTVSSILDDMATASGYLWFIDDSRRLQFGPGQSVTDSVFSLLQNGTFRDFTNLNWSTSFDNYANKVVVIGENIEVSEQDNAEIAERSQEAGGDSSGVYNFVIEDSNIKTPQQASTVALNHLSKYAIRQSKLSFESYTAGWQPGTRLRVRIPQITGFNNANPPVNVSWYYLIEEVSIRKEPGGIIVYQISATRRKESNFNTQKSDGFKEFFDKLVK